MAKRRRDRESIGPLTNIRREPGAWSVSLMRAGRLYSDYFGDAVYGGRDRALVAAQRFRDELLRRVPPDTRVRRRVPKGARGKTEVVGVSLEQHVVEGREYWRYVAAWRDANGRTVRRRYLTSRYGDEEAYALAVEARERGVAKAAAERRARQRDEAATRLAKAPPRPRRVKDPLSRKGIKMPIRRRRGK